MLRGAFVSILIYSIFSNALAELPSDIIPCELDDKACLTKTVQWVFKTTIDGIPSLGIDSSDPLHQDLIDADLSTIKFTLKNITTEGFKECQIESTTISSDRSSMTLDIMCPRFLLYGDYEISGRLVQIPIEGKGDFTMDCKTYRLVINVKKHVSAGEGGKKYVTLKSFKNNAELLGGMTVDLRNLFNGRKELAEPVLKFANENWKEVADLLQEPVLTANVKKILKNVNKLLKTIPFENLILE